MSVNHPNLRHHLSHVQFCFCFLLLVQSNFFFFWKLKKNPSRLKQNLEILNFNIILERAHLQVCWSEKLLHRCPPVAASGCYNGLFLLPLSKNTDKCGHIFSNLLHPLGTFSPPCVAGSYPYLQSSPPEAGLHLLPFLPGFYPLY